jgi:hypothetical protein
MKITGATMTSVYSYKTDDHFLEKVQFSDEATFHVSSAVNCCNVRKWGTENPHAYVKHQRDSPKANVFRAISSQKVYGPFFFDEETITGMTCLDMLQLCLMPQSQNIPTFIFQQDGNPAYFHCEVRHYLNTVLPGRWIQCASGNYQPLMQWTPRSPDNILCDFFLWRYVKDRVFAPPLPCDLADLEAQINAAVKNIDAPMLTRVWHELEYRIGVCHVSPVVHTSNISSCHPKKNIYIYIYIYIHTYISFPVAVNNSIKVGPLVLLL